jgi:hypothetical protein
MSLLKKRQREEKDINKQITTNCTNIEDNLNNKNYKKSEIPSFLANLYEILQSNEYNDIIEWSENGKSFIVKNLTDFSEKVIPRYWKHNNFASFVRQVNI